MRIPKGNGAVSSRFLCALLFNAFLLQAVEMEEMPNPDQSDYGYFDFYAGIDTTLMGNKTYQQV